ncbi:MAG: ArsR family transcriptional regulator [Thermoplasmata archaeon]|nr:MAG: ArsR family transcriptional regulator [Thermoplasmata archaeon]
MDDQTLTLKNRRDLYQYICKNPGMHLRAIERAMKISLGDIRYHLEYLEKEGLITSQKDEYKRTYFSAEDIYHGDRETLALLRQDSPRKILLFLINHPSSHFEDIQQELKKSKSTISFHLNKLIKCNIIEVKTEDNKNEYSIIDIEQIIRLLITYRSSFIDDTVDRVVEMWLR